MKKFLIVLAMVAMVSLLMGAGCFVTPEPEPVENNPPEIISSAITSGKVGVAYNYGVEATDPDEDVLTYSLTEKPLSMSIVATTGIISWIPTDAGVFGVGVKVSDPDGLFDVQSFSITVAKADEPEPDPELVLVGITVDPKTMDLIVGGTEDIVSVTAYYEMRGYEVILDFDDCLFLTSDKDVATVSAGEVTAEGVGTADILVSYKGKSDTLKVTVTYVPMEIKVDTPIFFEAGPLLGPDDHGPGVPEIFTIDIVANSDAGEKVLPHLILSAGVDTVTVPPTGTDAQVLIEFWLVGGGWLPLNILPDGTIDLFPSYLLEDVTDIYKVTFNKPGNYSVELVFKTFPGDVTLGSKVIEAIVLPAP